MATAAPIGKYFHIEEFLTSETAARAGRELILPPELLPNLQRLVDSCLDPLREVVGRPLIVSSGYRPPWLNDMIGGAGSSAHLEARAADVICPGIPNRELAEAAVKASLPFDQVILEFPPQGWVHIAVVASGQVPRAQRLSALYVAGATRYYNGFVTEAPYSNA